MFKRTLDLAVSRNKKRQWICVPFWCQLAAPQIQLKAVDYHSFVIELHE